MINNIDMEHWPTLRKLDQVVGSGRAGEIETQYGSVVVHSTRHHGFVAEHVDPNNVKRIAYGYMPSTAFLKLAGMIKELFG